MTTYRLYYLTRLGKIGRAEVLEAKDDDEAIRLANGMKLPVTCEVWDRDRMIAAIPAHQE